MGEARRRKKRDSNYGKLKSLITSKDCVQFIDRIVDDLYSECKSELKALFSAENIPDNYRQIRAQLSEWMKNKFSEYRDSDYEAMAIILMKLFSEMFEQEKFNHIAFMCFIEILKPYLPLNVSKDMEDMIENFNAELELVSPS